MNYSTTGPIAMQCFVRQPEKHRAQFSDIPASSHQPNHETINAWIRAESESATRHL
jgi:hypothetical protein